MKKLEIEVPKDINFFLSLTKYVKTLRKTFIFASIKL